MNSIEKTHQLLSDKGYDPYTFDITVHMFEMVAAITRAAEALSPEDIRFNIAVGERTKVTVIIETL